MNARSKTRLRRTLLSSTAAALAAMLALAVQPAHAETENPTLKVKYDAVGSTHIGAMVNASMPLGPSEILTEMDLVTTDIVDGALPIPQKVMNFSVFGIPTRAKVTMTQVGPLTGTLTPTGERGKLLLASNVSYDIKLSNVEAKVFGIWWPLGIGSNCHTAEPVDIAASTPAGEYFTINDGGRVTDTYSIGSFTGCTPLNYLDIPGFIPWFGSIPVNVLVSGDNNTLELTLDNPRYGGE